MVVVILIFHKIIVTNLQGNVLKLEGRINNQILEVEGFLMIQSGKVQWNASFLFPEV